MAMIETTPTEDLLGAVDELAPLIRAHSAEAERERRLPAPVAEALRDAGFFRMFRPHSRGGLELDPVSEFRVAEALARVDSAAAWNVQICNAGELFGAWFSDSVSSEVFGIPETIVAGAFNPHRRAVVVDGGYRVTGQVPFNSNGHNATWILGLADIYDGDQIRLDDEGNPSALVTISPAHDAQIVENWNTMGMCGTGSHDVSLDAVFVPSERAVPFAPLDQPPEAYDGPLAPLAIWATLGCLSSVAIGIAQSAVDDLVALGSKVPAYTQNSTCERSVVQMRLASAEGKVSAARALFHATFAEAWAIAQDTGSIQMPLKARCQLAATHALLASAEAVDLIHSCVGASGIRNEQNFQRYFRDIHVVTQHAFICESRLESVGQIMFGLEPDWPFFQF